MTLRPEMADYLQLRATSGLPEVWQATVETLRANIENRPNASGTPEKIYDVEHRFIPGPTSEMPVRIYRPVKHAPLPALVFFHGGGWVLNSLDIYEQSLRSLANKGQFIVVAVNFRFHSMTVTQPCFGLLRTLKSWVSTPTQSELAATVRAEILHLALPLKLETPRMSHSHFKP